MSGLISDISLIDAPIWSRYAAQSNIMTRLPCCCFADSSAEAIVNPSCETSCALNPAGVAAAAREMDVDVVRVGPLELARQQRLDVRSIHDFGIDHQSVRVVGAN